MLYAARWTLEYEGIYVYITYVRFSHFFIFVWGIRFVSVNVCIILYIYLFSFWGNFPLQSYWSLSCDHGLHFSDELMWEQQRQHVQQYGSTVQQQYNSTAARTIHPPTTYPPNMYNISTAVQQYVCTRFPSGKCILIGEWRKNEMQSIQHVLLYEYNARYEVLAYI